MNLQINPFYPSEGRQVEYRYAIAAVGYESRARYYFESTQTTAHERIMFVFSDQRIIDFSKNLNFFESHGFKSVNATAPAIKGWAGGLQEIVNAEHLEDVYVIVDISSMNRLLIASLCYEIAQIAIKMERRVNVDFVYSIAKYGVVPEFCGPIVTNGPALASLGGWSKSPSVPCGIILGIGYEEDLALGIIEELEASEIWGFRPKDHEKRYDEAIDRRNQGLFDEISAANLVKYSVFDPFSLYVSIESLIALTKSAYRLIVVPFGPKIFALASCLAVLRHYPEVGFWRVSGGANLEAVDREPLGKVLGLHVTFSPSNSAKQSNGVGWPLI